MAQSTSNATLSTPKTYESILLSEYNSHQRVRSTTLEWQLVGNKPPVLLYSATRTSSNSGSKPQSQRCISSGKQWEQQPNLSSCVHGVKRAGECTSGLVYPSIPPLYRGATQRRVLPRLGSEPCPETTESNRLA
ncbi:hypothetical protein Tco_0264347 [Tanacetum coccineum]